MGHVKRLCLVCEGQGLIYSYYAASSSLRSGRRCQSCGGTGYIINGETRGYGGVMVGPVPMSEMSEKDTERLDIKKEGE